MRQEANVASGGSSSVEDRRCHWNACLRVRGYAHTFGRSVETCLPARPIRQMSMKDEADPLENVCVCISLPLPRSPIRRFKFFPREF